jgi:hypothetical protein
MDKKIAAAFALIAKTTDRENLLEIAAKADNHGIAIVAEEARAKFDALVAEDSSDPIVPTWDNMIQRSGRVRARFNCREDAGWNPGGEEARSSPWPAAVSGRCAN